MSETPREIVVGNGKVVVALDNRMRIRDFYYPHVGLENHLAGHDIKFGVWTNDRFLWLGDNWQVLMKYMPETLVSRCLAKSPDLDLELEVNDAVHSFLDIYLRKVVVNNAYDTPRQVRLFFSHDFHVYGEDSGDTVIYDPKLKSIVHYKRKRYFLIDGLTDQNHGIYQFATGHKESLGKEGTWRDAEDGVLQGNPVAQGSVDSTVSFKLEMQPRSSNTVYYWIACGRNLNQVEDLDLKVKETGVEQMLLETENYWSAWVNRENTDLSVLPREIIRLFKTSLLVMRTHVDNGGGIISSCDSDILQFNRDTYSYVWPRDSAVAALAFDIAGFPEVSRMFFKFCDRTINGSGYFSHKYSPDGSIGSSWHALVDPTGHTQLPIQEDETALVLYALWKHFRKYRDLEFISKVYPRLVLKATEFLLDYRDPETGLPRPSFDLWEERAGVFTSTAATVVAALQSAAGFAKVFYDRERQETLNEAATQMRKSILAQLYDRKAKRFKKAVYAHSVDDLTVDSSLSFTFTCGVFDGGAEEVSNTMHAIVDRLWNRTDVGGLARYENDDYHRVSRETPGNPWFICTLWLARWYITTATTVEQLNKGLELLNWTAKRALLSGVLAEQIDPYTGVPISVSPLVWSHAEFVIAVCEYLDKYRELSSLISA
jgi:GH15 family glucan-1,4-alpha-glucosidase